MVVLPAAHGGMQLDMQLDIDMHEICKFALCRKCALAYMAICRARECVEIDCGEVQYHGA